MDQQNQLYDLGQQSLLRIMRSARSSLGQENGVDDKPFDMDHPMHPRGPRSSLGMGRQPSVRTRQAFAGNSENVAPIFGGNSEKLPQNSALGGALGDATNRSLSSIGAAAQQTKVDNQMKPVREAPKMRQRTQTERLPTAECSQIESGVRLMEDPQQVMEYLPDIFHVLQREEMFHAPTPGYIDCQVHVNAKMRGILVDWLVSVQQKYKLKAETLFLTVSLLDRYLEKKATARRNLQLVGVTALLIAAKFEEIHPPQISDLVYVTDKAYTRDDIVKMEVTILTSLDFKICRPTPMQFFERYQVVNECTDTHRDLAQYLLELTLADYNMIKYSSSHLAAAALLLSNKLLKRQSSWTPAAVKETHFTEQMLKECAKEMCPLLEYAEHHPLQAVRKKFSLAKYHSVAKLTFTGAPTVAPAQEEVRRPSGGVERRRSVTGNEGPRFSTNSPGAPPPPVFSSFVGKSAAI